MQTLNGEIYISAFECFRTCVPGRHAHTHTHKCLNSQFPVHSQRCLEGETVPIVTHIAEFIMLRAQIQLCKMARFWDSSSILSED